MRYSVAVKFVAIILCAAALLGVVGSSAGLVAPQLVAGQNVEEAYKDELNDRSIAYAQAVGRDYFSQNPGGASEEMLARLYGYSFGWEDVYFEYTRVCYTMKDEAGNVVSSKVMPFGDPVESTIELPVTGQYHQVISVTPYMEYYPELDAGKTTQVFTMPGQSVTEIHRVILDHNDGRQFEYHGENGNPLAVLTLDSNRFLNLHFHETMEVPMGDGWYVNHILLLDAAGNVVYEAHGEPMVILGISENDLHLPVGDVTEVSLSGVIVTSGDYESYDAIPDAGITVAQLQLTYGNVQEGDVSSEGISAPDLIGTLSHDPEGNVVFQSSEPMSMDTPVGALIIHIRFLDANEKLIYEAKCPNGVGSISYYDEGYLRFTGFVPEMELIPAETMIEETLPEPTEPEHMGTAVEKTVTALKTALYAMPDVNAEQLVILEADVEIQLLQVGSFQSGEEEQLWGLTEGGWIRMDDVMTVTEHIADTPRVLTAEDFGKIFASPNLNGDVLGTLEENADPQILKTGEFNGLSWGLTPEGWILMGEPVAAAAETLPEETIPEETLPEETVVVTIPEEIVVAETTATVPEEAAATAFRADSETQPVTEAEKEPLPYDPEDIQKIVYYDPELRQDVVAEYVSLPIPDGYTVEVQLAQGAMGSETAWTLLRIAEGQKNNLLKLLGFSVAVLAVTTVYLCCAAGRRKGLEQPRAGGLNRLPLDLYLCADGIVLVGLAGLIVVADDQLAISSMELALSVTLASCALMALLVVAFCFAFVAQIKTPGGYWWRNSICGRIVLGCLKLCGWLTRFCEKHLGTGKNLCVRFFRWLWRICVAMWIFGKKMVLWIWDVGVRLLRWAWAMMKKAWNWGVKKFVRFFGLLPITWQFLVTGFVLVFFLYVMLRSYKVGWILVGFGVFFAVILYAASAFAILLESAKRMRKGDLDTKVDDRMLIGGFRDFSEELNGLAGVAVVAAQKQLKSERMKTELITNVSHDIKTPLTSIINYVDLLQKPHTEQEQTAYLEVLDRQSQRLKKLIDDLMEMSKASTGNMTVEIQRMDAGEAINQALGEFADKLERAELTPVFRQPEDKVEMMADGRLVWRVMSNLLSNAAKYALPGTRIYIDLLKMDGKVIISMKNISREELNVNAEELMERFVRGDASRNTEGSGLGLNIAQSLMELQKGQLQVLVDGDLFKVTLIFSGV